MRYFIIAGEVSGDQHGAGIVREITRLDPEAEIEYWGGDAMEKVVQKPPLKHIRDLSFMGFIEVIKNIATISRNFELVKSQMEQFKPDKVVFIDFPGFNLRLAKWCKAQSYRTYYYISPTVWAWKSGRKEKVRKYIDRMMVILPFEKAWYAKHSIDVSYVGNPSLEQIKTFKPNPEFKVQHHITKPCIALLPGSRKQEINYILPDMIKAAAPYAATHHILIPKPSHLPDDIYAPHLAGIPHYSLIKDDFYNVLNIAEGALVASGTATLETALMGVPQVVCYKAAPINFAIAKAFVKLKYISLVNLILDKPALPELIQGDMTVEALTKQLNRIMTTGSDAKAIKLALEEVLGTNTTSANVAEIIVKG